MIPFRDNIPSRTYPIITISIIVINTLAFLYELSLGSSVEFLIEQYGVIPLKTMDGTSHGVSALAIIVPYFTSIFLHGGWAHLIGNMWYLWIFGDNVEDRLGHMSYLLFYILCGLGAGIVHTIANVSSPIPSIGASGAIAGVLGAYFMSYPHARVLTLIPLFIFFQVIEIPALIVLGFWFILQFLSGAASFGAAGGGVAWWAHVGGVLVGILLLAVFPKKRLQPYESYSRS
jgi:membrane associated rhomboid family serine protease